VRDSRREGNHLRSATAGLRTQSRGTSDASSELVARLGIGTQLLRVAVAAALLLFAFPVAAWTPKVVATDPLVRMPGTQPSDGVALEAPNKCLNCHDNYDPNIDIGTHWRGSMMGQAARDPIFWATFTVALQDSIWALGTPNAGDLCLRCHSPPGWLGGRSDPPNGSALAQDDFDGVTCDSCHRMVDPRFEQTFAGTREGSDWLGYWDETNLGTRPSSGEAQTTRLADRAVVAPLTFFNGNLLYSQTSFLPVSAGWLENGGGQLVVSPTADKRASFADTNEKHGRFYSRYHKSRYFCGSCHDVSNAVMANLAFAGTPPGNGSTVLPTEQQSASAYAHVERTFSEFMLSDHGLGGGAAGSGYFDPSAFTTSRPGNLIATCQDCHLPDRVGAGCNKPGTIVRPGGSVEHPKSGHPLHDLTGGNTLMPWILASSVSGSANYDSQNAALLNQGPAVLTANFVVGEGLDPAALLASVARATQTLQRTATVENLSYTPATGALAFRIRNHTGHKLISGYPEGRRMFVTVRGYTSGAVSYVLNPYDAAAGTLKGLPSASSPPLGTGEVHTDALVYEAKMASTLTGEAHTFHFALATGRAKDNRIPPRGFRIAEAAARLAEPVNNGLSAPSLFTSAEYAGGYDDVSLVVPASLGGVEVSVYYQSTSREYVEFLQSEINGTASTLGSPTPSGELAAYVAASDPFFAKLKAWGDVIWQLWSHNKNVPGAAPILMAQATWGSISNPCAQSGSDGTPCNDGTLCTINDQCASGVCAGSPVVCPTPDQCHTAGSCTPATGVCTDPAKANGTACSDGNACTTGDACQGGSCLAGVAVACSALDECHLAGVCNPADGACSNPAKPDGSPCSIGTCQAGACTATPDAGTGGNAGSAGTSSGGSAGNAGTSSGGSAGSAGNAGTSSGGSAGSAGTPSGGSSGTSGGTGGAITGGTSGAAGNSGGTPSGGAAGGTSTGGSMGTSGDESGCGCSTPGNRAFDVTALWLGCLALLGRRRLSSALRKRASPP
jgi:hypothetical protein